MPQSIWWANENGAMSDASVRAMATDSTLTIIDETPTILTVEWPTENEIEMFNKQIRKGRTVVRQF